jgi:hypothetical protein
MQLLTKRDVCDIMKISIGKLDGLIKDSKIKYLKIQKSVRFTQRDVDNYIQSQYNKQSTNQKDMTVTQLIQILSTIDNPDDVRVMVRGYEGGVDDIVNITPDVIHVALDVNDEWYYGKHETVDDMYDAPSSNYQIVKAIIL